MSKDLVTIAALRVFNSTRSCLYVKQLDNGFWTLPSFRVPNDTKDMLTHVPDLIGLLKKSSDFKVVSALGMLDVNFDCEPMLVRVVIYDLKYAGKVEVGPKEENGPPPCKWITRQALAKKEKVTFQVRALLDAMEEHECLR
jgi:hypothetical protein